jgi:thiamine pyrophosphokinase
MIPICVFGSGHRDPLEYYRSFLKQSSIIVAVDGGANILKELDIMPNWVIGDFDSVTPETIAWLDKNEIKKICYPKEKDFSDFELACQKIIADFPPGQIDLFCLQGERSDHFLFNLIIAEFLLDKGYNSIFHSQEETIYFFDSNCSIKSKGMIGDNISILPIKNSVLIHQTIGLK